MTGSIKSEENSGQQSSSSNVEEAQQENSPVPPTSIKNDPDNCEDPDQILKISIKDEPKAPTSSLDIKVEKQDEKRKPSKASNMVTPLSEALESDDEEPPNQMKMKRYPVLKLHQLKVPKSFEKIIILPNDKIRWVRAKGKIKGTSGSKYVDVSVKNIQGLEKDATKFSEKSDSDSDIEITAFSQKEEVIVIDSDSEYYQTTQEISIKKEENEDTDQATPELEDLFKDNSDDETSKGIFKYLIK